MNNTHRNRRRKQRQRPKMTATSRQLQRPKRERTRRRQDLRREGKYIKRFQGRNRDRANATCHLSHPPQKSRSSRTTRVSFYPFHNMKGVQDAGVVQSKVRQAGGGQVQPVHVRSPEVLLDTATELLFPMIFAFEEISLGIR